MKTTAAHFESFRTYCERWKRQLGLTDWYVYYAHEGTNQAYANTSWENGGRVATIRLSTSWDKMRPLSDHELNKLALHEVLHIALADLISHAEARYINEENLQVVEHTIIRRLEYAIFKEEKHV